MGKLFNLSRRAIRHKLTKAERVYKLFKKIGKWRIEQLVESTIETINKCKDQEVKKLIEHFKEK
jgi:hypothetical protein